MSVESSTEADVLESEVRRLEAEGYDVFVQPRPPQTPEFLGNFIPDAIAIGKGKKLVIEVARNSAVANRALQDISARFAQQNEWELRIVLVSPRTSGVTLPVSTTLQIESALAEIRQLRNIGALRPAFLMSWAALEAEARRLLGDKLGRPQTPARVVQMLGQEGYLSPDETDTIRKLADFRNRIIHGELAIQVSQRDVDELFQALVQLRTQEPPP